MNAELAIGDEAPGFNAAAAGPEPGAAPFRLADLRGQRVTLCFFPHDDVPAVTEQLGALRDAWDALREKTALFGVSRDTVENHQRIVERFGLPFALLTDEDNHVARAYGIWLGQGGGGDVEGGSLTERATFVIDAVGSIEAILRDEKPTAHAANLLALLEA